VAVVSHVPHLVAATLMNAATVGAEQDGALLRLAAGGFRDMTRVAAGHPGIWPDICAENAGPIVAALDALMPT
jgi:prephenate dehydrogenase